ncbi:MAG TPA: cell wall-binding repeat-containing protein [Acidimicrobiales bacterium]|nr:cell wall-binding repeat-containing protein [Acidimicrobiales bacterium]
MRRPLLLVVALALVLAITAPGAHAAEMRRIAGPDRYATAAAVALDRWRHPSDVVLASGSDPADALAGAYLSGLHGSPVLLAERDAVPAATLDALRAMDPSTIHVLGGTASIGAGAVATLEGEGYTVVRHAGGDRFGTAAAVAGSGGAAIVGVWLDEGPTALVANGRRPFDALAAGPLAAGHLLPILLTEAVTLPRATSAALDDLGIRHVVVLGGTAAVSDSVVAALESSGRTVRRVAGSDRTATATAVADLLGELGHVTRRASLTSATAPFDALGAGPWGAPDTPVLLCESPTFCGASTLEWSKSRQLEEVVVIGGEAAVSDAAAVAVAAP